MEIARARDKHNWPGSWSRPCAQLSGTRPSRSCSGARPLRSWKAPCFSHRGRGLGARGRGNPLLSSLSSLPSWPAFLSNFPCPAKVAFNRTYGTITAESKAWTNAQTLSHGNGWLEGGGSVISLLWGEPGWEPLKKGLNYTKL